MHPIEIYHRWIDELWNGTVDRDGLTDVASSLVTSDFVGHWPGREVRGPAELAAVIAETKAMFDEVTFTLDVQPFAGDDHVAARWVGAGVRDGETTRFTGNDILRLDGERFAEYWVGTVEQ
ncbi:nuclear transport factor 2 family protein [Gordonia sp. OPL2]|uniref:nuclear transport factor 2 family protein n=1 Tax=Gordonia sp. OPL2 TaxID=2486274 RepID=UPI0016564D7D|nr:nuclear transport factor 2 family protein [Gordonia sp. OPL2]ROZ89199.1 nuclear transport factor 2 family protein [Gordonia sp. OPL2]